MITDVPVEHIDKFWPIVSPWLRRSCKYAIDGQTIDSIKQSLLEEKARLWIAFDEFLRAALVTQVLTYPHCKSLLVWACGGRAMKTWLPELEKALESYAFQYGCSRIEFTGRVGWKRVLKKDRIAAITIIRELK